MANTIKFGNGQWATKKDSILAYNDENANFKPLPFVTSRASTATRVNKAGLLETVASGIPRVDYLGNTKGALLLEPQSTNLLTYSNDFSDTSWAKETSGTGSAPIVTPNIVTSPDGTLNGDKIVFNTGSGTTTSDESFIEEGVTTVAGVKVSQSIYLKGETGGETVLIRGAAGSAFTTLTLTDKWVRYDATETSFTAFSYFKLGLRQGVGGVAINSTATIYVYGAQFEEQSYATSYIPTNGSTVTRLAESADNAGNNQVISSSEGVLYFEGSVSDTLTNSWISLYEKSNITNNQFNLRFVNSTNLIQCVSRAGGLGQDVVLEATITDKTVVNKIAVKYKLNDWALWVNGVEVAMATSSTAFTPNSLDVLSLNRGNNSQFFYGNVKDLIVYNTVLTDLELEALTQV